MKIKLLHCLCVCSFLCPSCIVVEWIPTRIRTVVGTMTAYCYTTGQLILAAVAYNIRDWRWLTLAVSLPFYVFFLYSWYIVNIHIVLLNMPFEA